MGRIVTLRPYPGALGYIKFYHAGAFQEVEIVKAPREITNARQVSAMKAKNKKVFAKKF